MIIRKKSLHHGIIWSTMEGCCLLLCLSISISISAATLQLQKLMEPHVGNHQKQAGGTSLNWSYPLDPVDPVREPPVNLPLQQTDVGNRVAVRCGNHKVEVEVSQDLLGVGRLAAPEEVTLGHCPPSEVDHQDHVLIFESKLHECSSTRLMTDDAFIYAFDLIYNPRATDNLLITRNQKTDFKIQCHYKRNSRVSSARLHMRPRKEFQPRFLMQLMNEDWSSPRMSHRYDPEDVIRIQTSVGHGGPGSLKVLVDHCISTVLPAPPSEDDRAFVKNHGCLGGRMTGSTFMSRPRPDLLHFHIRASTFPLQKMVLLTCLLKAVSTSSPTTIDNKACFYDRGWRAVQGNHLRCSCCASTCGMRKARGLDDDDDDDDEDETFQTEASVGPIIIEANHFIVKPF